MENHKYSWKNLIWNYTTRLWYCWKFRKSRWHDFYCSKRIWNSKQKAHIYQQLQKELPSKAADYAIFFLAHKPITFSVKRSPSSPKPPESPSRQESNIGNGVEGGC